MIYVICCKYLDRTTFLFNMYCPFTTSFDYSAKRLPREELTYLNKLAELKAPLRLVPTLDQGHSKLTRLGPQRTDPSAQNKKNANRLGVTFLRLPAMI